MLIAESQAERQCECPFLKNWKSESSPGLSMRGESFKPLYQRAGIWRYYCSKASSIKQ